MQIKIKTTSKTARIPTYAKNGDAGCDLYADLVDTIRAIVPGECVSIPTGVCLQLPEGYCARVLPRSSQGWSSIDVHHGLIDSGYRGEIVVIVRNLGSEAVYIGPGERIAQLVIQPFVSAQFEEVDELGPSQRGEGGFGSSGK